MRHCQVEKNHVDLRTGKNIHHVTAVLTGDDVVYSIGFENTAQIEQDIVLVIDD
jgi:hypothetical protein